MRDDYFLELYDRALALKIGRMASDTERLAFLQDLFGVDGGVVLKRLRNEIGFVRQPTGEVRWVKRPITVAYLGEQAVTSDIKVLQHKVRTPEGEVWEDVPVAWACDTPGRGDGGNIT